jgi:inorganic pyrophosphatase
MTIEQTVEIPADHRLTIEVPPEIPAGKATITVSISPRENTIKISRQMRHIMKFYGCLKNSQVFEGDPVEIQRQMRTEWDRPWDKHE